MTLFLLPFPFLCLFPLSSSISNFNLIKVMNKQGCCYTGTCEKTAVREHPVVMGFGLLTQKYHPPPPPHRRHTCWGAKHARIHTDSRCTKSLALKMLSDVASLLSLRLLSSSFQFFFSSNASFKTLSLSSLSFSTLPCLWLTLYIPLRSSISLCSPPLWSRVWVLLGERCATQMMSHPVTLSSPPLLLPPPPHPPALQLAHRAEHFLLTRQTQIAHTCGTMVRGACKRCHFILTQAFPSDRDVKPPLSQKQQAPHQQICTCRLVAALLFEGTVIFWFFFFFSYFNTLFSSSVHMRRIQMVLFLKAVMEYDMLIIFPRPWQIALTAYYACFLTFVLFVSLPQWPLNLGFVGNGR